MQDPLWQQFWSHCPADTVLQERPKLIGRERLCLFLNIVFMRYMDRGVEFNSCSSASRYLFEVLARSDRYTDKAITTVIVGLGLQVGALL